jgi:hypothetical protein
MKHIKLFEAFSEEAGQGPAQLLVSGDWTGITKDGSPETFIAPATFIFQYLPAGSPIPSGYGGDAEEPISDLDSIAEESFSGDQGGANVAPRDFVYMQGDRSQRAMDMRQGVVRMFIDPKINPSELESYLRKECDRIWSIASDNEYYTVLDYDDDIFEPEYWKLAMADKPFPRKVVFTIE